MENASKALIIAGAILISIVLITLGVVILGQGQEVVNSSNIDDVQVQQFNNKYIQYCGDKISGSNVNSLINSVISNNIIANRDGEADKIIKLDIGTTDITIDNADKPTKFQKKAQTGKVYHVEVEEYNANTGYVSKIKISNVGSGT